MNEKYLYRRKKADIGFKSIFQIVLSNEYIVIGIIKKKEREIYILQLAGCLLNNNLYYYGRTFHFISKGNKNKTFKSEKRI